MRFIAFQDRPPKTLRRGLRAFRASVAVLLRSCRDSLGTDAAGPSLRRLVTRARQLQDVVIAVQQEIDAVAAGNEWELLRTGVIELELSLEALVDCVAQMIRQGLSDTDRHRVQMMLDSALGRIQGCRDILIEDALIEIAAMTGGRIPSPFHRVLHAITSGDLPWEMQPGISTAANGQQTSHSPAPPSQNADDSLRRLKHAVKATLAAGLAILAGHAISGARWYWAVIAAFIVFTSAETVSEQLVRAWQRVLGTAVGVIAGIVLADVSGRSPNLDLALIFLLLAVGLYLRQIMYAWFVLALTMMLAILYSFMGRYSPGLLLLRLEETLVGAAIGVAVAVLVFPASSRTKLRGQAAQVLRCASDLVRALGLDAESNSYSPHFETQRELQGKVADLRTALAARTTIFQPVGTRAGARLLSRTANLAYCVRHLAAAAAKSESMRMTAAQTTEIARDLCTIADALEGNPLDKSFKVLRTLNQENLQPTANSDWQDRTIASIAGFAVELGFSQNSDSQGKAVDENE